MNKLVKNFNTLAQFNISMSTYQAMKCLDKCLDEKANHCNFPINLDIYHQIISGEITFDEAVEIVINENKAYGTRKS